MIKGKVLVARVQNLVYTCLMEREREHISLPTISLQSSEDFQKARFGFAIRSMYEELKLRRKLLSPQPSEDNLKVTKSVNGSEDIPVTPANPVLGDGQIISNDGTSVSPSSMIYSIKSPVYLKLTYIVNALKMKFGMSVEYNRKKFAAAIAFYGSDKIPNISVLFFQRKSKIVCTGSKDIQQARFIIIDFISKLKAIGYKRIVASELICQNMVCSTFLGFRIDIEKINEKFCEFCTYDEEQFPGIFIKHPQWHATFVGFTSGRLIIAGTKTAERVSKLLDFAPSFFGQFAICEVNRLPDGTSSVILNIIRDSMNNLKNMSSDQFEENVDYHIYQKEYSLLKNTYLSNARIRKDLLLSSTSNEQTKRQLKRNSPLFIWDNLIDDIKEFRSKRRKHDGDDNLTSERDNSNGYKKGEIENTDKTINIDVSNTVTQYSKTKTEPISTKQNISPIIQHMPSLKSITKPLFVINT